MTFESLCDVARAAFLAGEEPFNDVRILIDRFYAMPGNEAGGLLHCVLDDSNLEDEHIDYSIAEAGKEGDGPAISLATLLRAMTLKQRLQVPGIDCPCGCQNELRESVGLPVIPPRIIMEQTEGGGIFIRPAVPQPPPPAGWVTLEVVGIRKPDDS